MTQLHESVTTDAAFASAASGVDTSSTPGVETYITDVPLPQRICAGGGVVVAEADCVGEKDAVADCVAVKLLLPLPLLVRVAVVVSVAVIDTVADPVFVLLIV